MSIGGSESSWMLMERIAAIHDRPRDQHCPTLGLQALDRARTEFCPPNPDANGNATCGPIARPDLSDAACVCLLSRL